MRAFQIQEKFGLENLRLTELPDPGPGPGEVLLKMRAVSLNYRDILTVAGTYNPRQPLPLTPCSDGVGEVAEVGEGVASLKAGDRVATLFSQDWMAGEPTADNLRATLGGPIHGTLSELMVLPERGVIGVPDHLTDTEAATLPCAALTAWIALVEQGHHLVVATLGGGPMQRHRFVLASGADRRRPLERGILPRGRRAGDRQQRDSQQWENSLEEGFIAEGRCERPSGARELAAATLVHHELSLAWRARRWRGRAATLRQTITSSKVTATR